MKCFLQMKTLTWYLSVLNIYIPWCNSQKIYRIDKIIILNMYGRITQPCCNPANGSNNRDVSQYRHTVRWPRKERFLCHKDRKEQVLIQSLEDILFYSRMISESFRKAVVCILLRASVSAYSIFSVRRLPCCCCWLFTTVESCSCRNKSYLIVIYNSKKR